MREVTKTHGPVRALDHIDLDIHSGEFLTLLGPSGSGKTTLLMVLAGFARPDFGSLKFGDQEVIRLAPHKRGVGMVFQNYALFPHMNVGANIAFPLRLRSMTRADIAQRVERALEMVQLAGYAERRVDQLSGGQRGVSTGGAMASIPPVGAAVTLGLAAEDTILLPEENPAS